MNGKTPEQRLRDHVEAVLDRSAVPPRERDDVADELYGHLWQRWQDMVARGLDPAQAADEAVAAFGAPSEVGRDLTLAFHSRLYASTIGTLLPEMAAVPDRPKGFTRIRFFLACLVVNAAIGAVWALDGLSPLRAGVVLLGLGLFVAVLVLAYRAMARAQRWALEIVWLGLLLALVDAGFTLLNRPLTFTFAGLAALVALAPARSQPMAAWMAHVPTIGLRLRLAVRAVVLVGFVLPYAAPAVPDPTLIGPSDVDLRVSLACSPGAGATTTTAAMTIELTVNRGDLLPSHLLPSTVPGELLIAQVTEPDWGLGHVPGFWDSGAWGWRWAGWDARDATTGGVTDFSGAVDTSGLFYETLAFPETGPWPGNSPPLALPIGSGALVTGHRYVVTVNFRPAEEVEVGPGQQYAQVLFNYRNRFGLLASVGCGQTSVARPADFGASPGILP